MSPFEAGTGTGKEAVVGSGKEARGLPLVAGPQLIVIAGIDEAEHYSIEAWSTQQTALVQVANQIRLLRPRSSASFSLWQYPPDHDGPRDFIITPPGEEVPSMVTVRRGRRNRITGDVDEDAQEWASFVEAVAPHELGRESTGGVDNEIIFILDDSGSMNRLDWQNLPARVGGVLSARYPETTTRTQRWNRSNEEWLGWLVEAADWFIGVYGP
jgi:hypothetical protein